MRVITGYLFRRLLRGHRKLAQRSRQQRNPRQGIVGLHGDRDRQHGCRAVFTQSGRTGTIDLFILLSVIISFGLIPILLTAKPAPAFSTSSQDVGAELYRASPLALIGNCLTGMAHGTIFGLGAIYATEVLVDLQAISLFMACFLIGSLMPSGRSAIFPIWSVAAASWPGLSVISIMLHAGAWRSTRFAAVFTGHPDARRRGNADVFDLYRLRQRSPRTAPDRRRQRQPGHGRRIRRNGRVRF